MRSICLIILAAVAGITGTAAEPSSEEARKAGEAWLSLVDNQKYEQSWKEADAQFQSEVTVDQWEAALKRSRDPLGAMVSRAAPRANFAKTLRGAPDGEYVIFHFQTDFKNREGATERLTLVQKDGKWRVVAYAIH
jgi:hypothetical protein